VVELIRDGEPIEVILTAEEKGKFAGEDIECPLWGFAVREVTETIARDNKLGSKRGVYVSGIQAGSSAARGGLNPTSIVLRVDGRDVTDIEMFTDVYEASVADRKRLVLLEAKRGPVVSYVLIRVRYGEEEGSEEQ
jgi:S1-C subfamily serine protease